MPANVETMFYVGETPWHGLGKALPENALYDIKEGIKLSGLGWSVDVEPLFRRRIESVTTEGNEVTLRERYERIDCRQCTVRSDNGTVLGSVGPRYTPLQNDSAFDWFTPFLETKAAALHTAGSLDEGRQVWVLAKLQLENTEIVPGDEVAKFILLSNSHDGTTAVRVGFTPIRVVCANTLGMAHRDKASKLVRIRHHKNVEKTLEEVRNVMNLANQEFEATAEQYRFLATRPINYADLRRYIKTVLDIKEEKDKPLPTRTENTIEDIVSRFESGIGQKIPGVAGTVWAAYNGVTEYLNYKRGNSSDTRIQSLWFGPSAAMNELALKEALILANAS
jgi:phage/plasmid-like protein (TIGR03299 family)